MGILLSGTISYHLAIARGSTRKNGEQGANDNHQATVNVP